jgi:hypothetical protein
MFHRLRAGLIIISAERGSLMLRRRGQLLDRCRDALNTPASVNDKSSLMEYSLVLEQESGKEGLWRRPF